MKLDKQNLTLNDFAWKIYILLKSDEKSDLIYLLTHIL